MLPSAPPLTFSMMMGCPSELLICSARTRAVASLELPAVNEGQRRVMRAFVMKFQQITAPITAKGIEDTALYRFNRLISLNEVGGDPNNYGGGGVRAFHADAEYRARHWPHEMLATSTHDTKRSEDVRARLDGALNSRSSSRL